MRPFVPLVLAAAFAVLVASAGTPDARELARRLDADSARTRDEATQRLAALGEGARATLEDLVANGSPEARRRARRLLRELDADPAEETRRIRALEARELLRAAARRPGRLAEGTDLDLRLAQLPDEAPAAVVRVARARAERGLLDGELALALARHPSPDGVTTLADALRRDRVLCSDVVRAARLLDGAERPLLTSDALSHLEEVLAGAADPRRGAAAALLLALEPTRAPRFAHDLDARVRIEAAQALGRLGLAGARSLERLARDEDVHVCEAALCALLAVPGAPRPAPAVDCADHASARVRAAAARLLGRDATPATLPVLGRLATDDSARVRAAAERSLALLSRPR